MYFCMMLKLHEVNVQDYFPSLHPETTDPTLRDNRSTNAVCALILVLYFFRKVIFVIIVMRFSVLLLLCLQNLLIVVCGIF